MLSYLPWQFWDFAVDRGIAVLLVGGLMGISVLWPARVALLGSMAPEQAALALIELSVMQQVPILVIVGAGGIVANDRIGGYYRFLFSKPVRVPSYYALQFLTTLAGILAVALILMGAFWLTIGWVSPVVPMVMIAVLYAAFAGVMFFFSTFTKFDWSALVVLWGASTLSRLFAAGKPWYDMGARWILPPTHHIDKLTNALFAGSEIDIGGAAWLVGYGLAFFLAGLVVLHRKAIAE